MIDIVVSQEVDFQFVMMIYVEVVCDVIGIVMVVDFCVFMMGEDVGIYGGVFGVLGDFKVRMGGDCICDIIISEFGIVGVGVGVVMMGMCLIVEIQFLDFIVQVMDQIVNQVVKIYFMFGGVVNVLFVIWVLGGLGIGVVVQYLQSFEVWFVYIFGFKVVMLVIVDDVCGFLFLVIDDLNLVVVFEYKLFYKIFGQVCIGDVCIFFGVVVVCCQGIDFMIIVMGVEVSCLFEVVE